jgi:hypothetical protein
LTKPVEVWGNYHSKIAFFDGHNNIVYHRNSCFAHALQMDIAPDFVKWSDKGDAVIFYEYRRGNVSQGGIYHYLFIDLIQKMVYRMDQYKYDCAIIDNLRSYNFDKTDIINQILKIGIDKEECYTDKIIVSPLKWLAGYDKWKPAAKL